MARDHSSAELHAFDGHALWIESPVNAGRVNDDADLSTVSSRCR